MEINQQLLQKQNPWWFRKELILDDEKIMELDLKSHKYIPGFIREYPSDVDAVLTLRGPRQIGKSTTLKLIIRHLLLDLGIPSRNVFYFSLDRIEDFNQLYELLEYYLESIRPVQTDRLYIFLDEISFVREWQRGIKALADEGKLKKVTLLMTGSSLVDIGKGSERLPGRRGPLNKVDFEQLPLTFREFIELIAPSIEIDDEAGLEFNRDLIRLRFRDYLLTGGFPLSINLFYDTGFIPAFVYQLYLNWIEGDIGRAGKSERNLYRIMSRILTHYSTPVSWLGIGKESGITSHATVQEYVELLEKMYVTNIVPFMDISSKTLLERKNRKIYITDPLIYHCFSGKHSGLGDNCFSESRMVLNDPLRVSKLVESVVGEHLRRTFKECYYWQGKKEIDFVVSDNNRFRFFKVKYQENVSLSEFSWFSKSGKFDEILNVLSVNSQKQEKNITITPITIFLLQLGAQAEKT